MVRKIPTKIIKVSVIALKETYLMTLENALEGDLTLEASMFAHHSTYGVKKNPPFSPKVMNNGFFRVYIIYSTG